MAEGFAVWVVGLPGSGKSNLAKAVAEALLEWGHDTELLQMDERRQVYFPQPKYNAAEREEAYKLFAEEAAQLVRQGLAVVMDGSAYKVAFREYARSLIPRFCEVYVQCSLETAIARETKRPKGLVKAKLYQQALERRATGKPVPGLGEVIGVDTPFEENPAAEFVINNDDIPKQETRDRTLEFLRGWLGVPSAPPLAEPGPDAAEG